LSRPKPTRVAVPIKEEERRIFIKSQYCFILTDEQIIELVPATLTICQPNFKRMAVIWPLTYHLQAKQF